jgi:YidC/Oxa1 family membrane protein insertase
MQRLVRVRNALQYYRIQRRLASTESAISSTSSSSSTSQVVETVTAAVSATPSSGGGSSLLSALSSWASSSSTATVAPSPELEALKALIPHNSRYPDFSLTDATCEVAGYWGGAMNTLVQLESSLGMGWGPAIIASSLILRLATVPFFLKATQTGAWMQHHGDAIAAYSEQLQLYSKKKDSDGMRRVMLERREFMAKHGLLMRYVMLPALVQLPIFVTFFSTLRQAAYEAHLPPMHGLATGDGLLWISALHLPDPTFTLPLISSALSAAAIVINRNLQGAPQLDLTPGGQKILFGALSVVFNLATGWLPATVQIYITVTSGTMLMQQGMLRLAPLRSALSFPKDWPMSLEAIAERQRRRTLAGGESANTANVMIESMRGLQPLFRRASRIANGEFLAEPKHQYVTIFGLSDPGVPPPPPAQAMAAATIPSLSSAAATLANTSGTTNASKATSTTSASAAPVLLTHRPKKVVKKL